MRFIKFTEQGRSFGARASISKTGMLSFNDGAHRRYDMRKYRFVVLYYDPALSQVGIELTDDENADGARKLRHRDKGADVAAKSFCEFFNLGLRSTTIFDLEVDEESGLLMIDLKRGRVRGSKKA